MLPGFIIFAHMKHFAAILILLLVWGVPSIACTSVIVSGKYTRDGKAVMYKHRDSNCQDDCKYFDY